MNVFQFDSIPSLLVEKQYQIGNGNQNCNFNIPGGRNQTPDK